MPNFIILEGGGSRTRAVWVPHDPNEEELRTILPSLMRSDLDKSIDAMRQIISRTVQSIGRRRVDGLAAGLSIVTTRKGADALRHALATHLDSLGYRHCKIIVCNDIVPLLDWKSGLTSAAAICGTGTGYAAFSPERIEIRRASGNEYVLSDEGGGYDIGQSGLRSAIRALDGRGPETKLTGLALNYGNGSLDGLRNKIYKRNASEMKRSVASFAIDVIRAAECGDFIAQKILRSAVTEIVSGIAAVSRILNPSDATLTLSGSILSSKRYSRVRDDVISDAVQSIGYRRSNIRVALTGIDGLARMLDATSDDRIFFRAPDDVALSTNIGTH